MIRKSNLEILRIICMFGIISMHTFGQFLNTCTGINLAYGVFINSIFNMGVSCFMLISGYFGVKFSVKKVINLELMILFYGLLGQIISFACTGNIVIKNLFKSIFPISTGKYWYMSVYMIIIFTSKYIDKLIGKLDRKDFRMLICVLILFFYIMPSFTYFEIMNDSGKGIANMLTVYLTGRYIRQYHNDKLESRKMFVIGSSIIGCSFIVNYILSLLLKGGTGTFSPFARDCSITIYLGSIFFFLLFKNMCDVKSIRINKFASSVFAIYLFEGTIRQFINYFYDISIFGDKWYLFVVIALYVLIVMVIVFIIDSLKKKILGSFENEITDMIVKVLRDIKFKVLNSTLLKSI